MTPDQLAFQLSPEHIDFYMDIVKLCFDAALTLVLVIATVQVSKKQTSIQERLFTLENERSHYERESRRMAIYTELQNFLDWLIIHSIDSEPLSYQRIHDFRKRTEMAGILFDADILEYARLIEEKANEVRAMCAMQAQLLKDESDDPNLPEDIYQRQLELRAFLTEQLTDCGIKLIFSKYPTVSG